MAQLLESYSDLPVWPAKLYLMQENGSYDEPLTICSASHFGGIGPRMTIELWFRQHPKGEVRLCDPFDNLLFHMVAGKIVFPTQEDLKNANG